MQAISSRFPIRYILCILVTLLSSRIYTRLGLITETHSEHQILQNFLISRHNIDDRFIAGMTIFLSVFLYFFSLSNIWSRARGTQLSLYRSYQIYSIYHAAMRIISDCAKYIYTPTYIFHSVSKLC